MLKIGFWKILLFNKIVLQAPQKAVRVMGGGLISLMLSACSEIGTRTGIPSTLDPRGGPAADINTLWWLMFVLGTLVFFLVTGILLYILFRRRRFQPGVDPVDLHAGEGHSWILYGGVILPAVILTIVLVFTLRSLSTTAQPPEEAVVEIEVIGRQWFWDVFYVSENFATANEIHIPVGQPVLLRLTSADVIHSFWVPQLHGKIDLLPGHTNTFWIRADEPGIYRGLCAEFCGLQHARMHFIVVAEPEEEYNRWVERQSQPVFPAVATDAADAQDERILRGQEVFINGQCAFCHTIRGTDADGKLGPDLTHFASRQTIAAGTLANNRGNLGAWIANPQHIKPGNLMPDSDLSSEDLLAVLAFLESLE
jgi:cytochrome c oxidase subunit II